MSSFGLKVDAARFGNSLFNYSRRVRTCRLVPLFFTREERTFARWKGYEGAHIFRLENVRERFYVATGRVLSAAPNGAPVVVKQLYGVVGRAIDISSIPLSLPGNPACHDYCLQAACTMKALAIAAAGMEERYRGPWTRKGGWGRARGRSDKLHPLSTNDFVLFTNTFVPRLFILFLYRHPFFSLAPARALSLSLFFWRPLSPASSSMNVSPLHSRRSHVPALARGHIDASSGVPAIHK